MRLNNLDLNLLVTLDTLLTERSVSRTAQRLNVTQSAVSHALRRLRAHFGDELLISTGRNMVPTTVAETLGLHVRMLLAEIESLPRRSRSFVPEEFTYTLRIAAADAAAARFWAPLMRQLEVSAPGVNVAISTPSKCMPERFERAEIDFLVARGEHLMAGHPSALLWSEGHVCVGWSRNPSIARPLTKEEYLDMRHVTSGVGSSESGVTPLADDLLNALGYRRRIVAALPNLWLAAEFIVGTQCIATVPRSMGQLLAERYDLLVSPMPIPLQDLEVFLQWHTLRDNDPAFRWIRGQVLRINIDGGGHASAERRPLRASPSIARWR